jgi:hypothetical protein
VVLDGVVSDSAALVAHALAPHSAEYTIAGHRSTEPGARISLKFLNLDPLLDLDMRLGEGTGGLLAVPLVQAAARALGRWRPWRSWSSVEHPTRESIESLESPLALVVEVHEELSSTQERARALARSGTPHGTLVVAGVQTGGRGRLGRLWGSPAGGLWMSLVLRPEPGREPRSARNPDRGGRGGEGPLGLRRRGAHQVAQRPSRRRPQDLWHPRRIRHQIRLQGRPGAAKARP